MTKFYDTLSELTENSSWFSEEYESTNAQILFVNNIPEKKIEFALFENNKLMVEGEYQTEIEKIHYIQGELLKIVEHLTQEEQKTNILERLDLSLMMMQRMSENYLESYLQDKKKGLKVR